MECNGNTPHTHGHRRHLITDRKQSKLLNLSRIPLCVCQHTRAQGPTGIVRDVWYEANSGLLLSVGYDKALRVWA